MNILNSKLSHGHSNHFFKKTAVSCIPKSIRLNCSVSANYGAIALGCIFGNVLGKTLLSTQRDTFKTSEMQYDFMQNSSTVTCSNMVIETIEYYGSCNSFANRYIKSFRSTLSPQAIQYSLAKRSMSFNFKITV